MSTSFRRSAAPLIITIQRLFSEDLAKENDFLRQENKILRSKLGRRVPLTEADCRTLVRYGLPIRGRFRDVISIVRPETLVGVDGGRVGSSGMAAEFSLSREFAQRGGKASDLDAALRLRVTKYKGKAATAPPTYRSGFDATASAGMDGKSALR
jgi:hypothetical protein